MKFDKYEILYTYGNMSKRLFIPVSKKFIEYYSVKDENKNEDNIELSKIGQEDGERFTGEIEEIVLDLHNFDENIYRIFKQHGMLEIEGIDN
jgi:hypothetical protein